jgi:hypothetical protein
MAYDPKCHDLAALPMFIIRYMAPMNGPGKPYREEWMRREKLLQDEEKKP